MPWFIILLHHKINTPGGEQKVVHNLVWESTLSTVNDNSMIIILLYLLSWQNFQGTCQTSFLVLCTTPSIYLMTSSVRLLAIDCMLTGIYWNHTVCSGCFPLHPSCMHASFTQKYKLLWNHLVYTNYLPRLQGIWNQLVFGQRYLIINIIRTTQA